MGSAPSHGLEATAPLRTRVSKLGLSPESRLSRMQQHLEATSQSNQTLRSKIAQLSKRNEDSEATNAQLRGAIARLQAELDKLQSVAIQHVRDPSLIEVTDKKFVANLSVPSPPDSPTERDLLSVTNLPDTSSPEPKDAQRSSAPSSVGHRRAVAATSPLVPIVVTEASDMDETTKALIHRALQQNRYTGKLTLTQQRILTTSMTPSHYNTGEAIVQQGEPGTCLYVLAAGKADVYLTAPRAKEPASHIGPGEVFGELALLYNCMRTATVVASTKCKVWSIDRHAFKYLAKRAKQEEQQRLKTLFASMALFEGLNDDYIEQLVAVANEVAFEPGQRIVTEGQSGDTFYLITHGEVTVLRQGDVLRILHKGEHFGEGALLEACNIRTATCVAETDATCATLTREAFLRFIVPLEALGRLSYTDAGHGPSLLQPVQHLAAVGHGLSLDALEQHGTLGVGGFGRVTLVYSNLKKRYFALKAVAKAHIIETGQEEFLLNEKKIMQALDSSFCAPLYGTFRDDRFVYMLTEALLGGELWFHLRQTGAFKGPQARFYVGCVIEGLAYLHGQQIIYRDLKPENLMMDTSGYVKLVDFGFARQLTRRNQKTWTFCGTPEYMSPEIIMNQGHNASVDLWALGVLTYELLSGRTPFASQDVMGTYNLILMGISQQPWDSRIDGDAKDLIINLCREAPNERLGAMADGFKSVRKHRWFKTMDWPALAARLLPPPLVPSLDGENDMRNFEKCEDAVKPKTIGSCDWDADF